MLKNNQGSKHNLRSKLFVDVGGCSGGGGGGDAGPAFPARTPLITASVLISVCMWCEQRTDNKDTAITTFLELLSTAIVV